MIGELDQGARRQDLDVAAGPGCLGPAGLGANQPVIALIGGHGGRQSARHRRDRPVERQFSQHREALKGIGRNGPDGRHDAERDGQVVMTALLGQVGRGEVDRDALGWQGKARGDERRANPLAGLPHRFVRQADDHEGDRPRRNLNLHIDCARFDALERNRENARDHAAEPPPKAQC